MRVTTGWQSADGTTASRRVPLERRTCAPTTSRCASTSATDRLARGDVRYRFVLDLADLDQVHWQAGVGVSFVDQRSWWNPRD
ncbi:MAG: hypothetical protein ABWY11_01560 [Umezawaea sp.]